MKRLLLLASLAIGAFAVESPNVTTIWVPSPLACEILRQNHSPAAISCVPVLYVIVQSGNPVIGMFKVNLKFTQPDGSQTEKSVPTFAYPNDSGVGVFSVLSLTNESGDVKATAVAYVPEQ